MRSDRSGDTEWRRWKGCATCGDARRRDASGSATPGATARAASREGADQSCCYVGCLLLLLALSGAARVQRACGDAGAGERVGGRRHGPYGARDIVSNEIAGRRRGSVHANEPSPRPPTLPLSPQAPSSLDRPAHLFSPRGFARFVLEIIINPSSLSHQVSQSVAHGLFATQSGAGRRSKFKGSNVSTRSCAHAPSTHFARRYD